MNWLLHKENAPSGDGLRQARLGSSLLAIAALPVLLFPTPLAADTTTITEPPRLWVATADTTHQLRPQDPTFDLQLPGTQGTKALAIDAGTRQVWLRTPEAMNLFDAEGGYQMSWDLPSKGPGKSHLVTLPTDDSIWIAEDTFLESFGIGGQAHHQKLFPGKIQAIALDAPRSTLWVLTLPSTPPPALPGSPMATAWRRSTKEATTWCATTWEKAPRSKPWRYRSKSGLRSRPPSRSSNPPKVKR